MEQSNNNQKTVRNASQKRKNIKKNKRTKEIAYQNKDIVSKWLRDFFPKKSLNVYGVDTPPVRRLFPTNLPMIKVDELRLDNIFQFDDYSYAIVDYESKYRKKNVIKYMDYLTRTFQRFIEEEQIRLRMIVIYTADVERSQVPENYNIGALTITLENAFLSEMDSQTLLYHIRKKVHTKQELTDEEQMQFIILPLTYKGKKQKLVVIQELFWLAKEITDDEMQRFLIAGVVAFADKVIDKEMADQMKEWISMTKVARLFEQEKREAVKEAVKKEQEESKKDKIITAKKLLEDGIPLEKIPTYLSDVTIDMIREELPEYGKGKEDRTK